jgi:glycosyltransferase involved in cell wall biosynthesis
LSEVLAAQAEDRPGGAAGPERQLSVAGIDPELRFAGGEVQVLGLTRELIRRGHQADLLCDPRGRLFERAQRAGVRCYPLAIRNALDVGAGIRLRRILAAHRYDVVHFHTARAHSLAPFARGLAGARVVTRRMDYRPNRLFAPWLYQRSVEGVAAISEGVAEALSAAGVGRSRITIIPSGIDATRLRPPSESERAAARARWGLAADELAIGTVGALEPRKGQRFLLAALAAMSHDRAPRAGPRLRCFIAGDGTLRETLEAEAHRLGLSEQVRLVGQLEDPRELLWALEIFVLPSLREGLGVALLEAMGCGLAVVASAIAGAGAAVADGCGLAVEPGNVAALSAALARLAESEPLRQNLALAARERVLERYTLAASAEATLKFYFNSLGGRGRPRE